MSIIGRDAGTYAQYAQNVRAEFSIFPDSMFFEGRKSMFIEPTLSQSQIFQTDNFEELYGAQARINLKTELSRINAQLTQGPASPST